MEAGLWLDHVDLPPGIKPEIAELNAQFAVVTDAGRTLIWRPRTERGCVVFDRMRETDFKLHLANWFMDVSDATDPNKTKRGLVSHYWLQHRHRRSYQHVVFDPAHLSAAREVTDALVTLKRATEVPARAWCSRSIRHRRSQ